MKRYPPEYWDASYQTGKTGWDIGYVSTPLKEYFDQLTNKSLKILIPGAGNGWEVEYLFKEGFENTFMLDFSEKAIGSFKNRYPDFPQHQIIHQDFFKHTGQYDLIVEQTFFSALPRALRTAYARHCHALLKPGGKWVGLLFNHEFPFDYPPFGGSPEEYTRLFEKWFTFLHFESAYNSIKPRKDRELFILLLRD